MPDKKLFEINEDSFFRSFPRSSFEEKAARWVRLFFYGFIGVHFFTLILEKLHPYSVTPPNFFLQFLFFLMMAGILEVFCIQFASVKDSSALDFAKSLVTTIQYRFFFKKVSVIASFEQVRVVGVTARPPGIFGGLFSQTTSRYAIVIMNFRNQLILLTDYSLGLEEANEYIIELASRHMPAARIIQGEPDTELVADPFTGDVTCRRTTRTMLSLVDAATLPTLQAFSAALVAALIIGLTMVVLSKAAYLSFNTDLLIRYQPICQLFSEPLPRQMVDTPTPATGQPAVATTMVVTASASLQSTAVESTAAASISEELTAMSSAATETILFTTSDASAATETAPAPEITAAIPEPSMIEPPKTETVAAPAEKTPAISPKPEPDIRAISSSFKNEATQPPIPESPVKPVPAQVPLKIIRPIMAPLEAKIPAFVEPVMTKKQPLSRLASQTAAIAHVASAAHAPAPASTANSAVQVVAPTAAKSQTVIGSEIPRPQTVVTPVTPRQTKTVASATQEACSILPGYGVHPLVSIGDGLAAAIRKLGKPLAEKFTISGKQMVFNGISITSRNNDLISQINITRGSISKIGLMQTPQKISVGSPITAIKNRFGPPLLIDEIPGLHFPGLGISFIPSPTSPETVGVIKIYQAGTRPN